MAVRYLEDVAARMTFTSGPARIDADQITHFAAEFGPQPFFTSATKPRARRFSAAKKRPVKVTGR